MEASRVVEFRLNSFKLHVLLNSGSLGLAVEVNVGDRSGVLVLVALEGLVL